MHDEPDKTISLQQLLDALVLAEDERDRYKQALMGLLLSADCLWEQECEGHEWVEAVRVAREALSLTPEIEA